MVFNGVIIAVFLILAVLPQWGRSGWQTLHFYSTIALFGNFLAVAVAATVAHNDVGFRRRCRAVLGPCAVAVAIGIVAVVILKSSHLVLALEYGGILLLGAYWLVQTRHFWNIGLDVSGIGLGDWTSTGDTGPSTADSTPTAGTDRTSS